MITEANTGIFGVLVQLGNLDLWEGQIGAVCD